MQINNIINPWDSISPVHDWGVNAYSEIIPIFKEVNPIDEYVDYAILFLGVYILFLIIFVSFLNTKDKFKENGNN